MKQMKQQNHIVFSFKKHLKVSLKTYCLIFISCMITTTIYAQSPNIQKTDTKKADAEIKSFSQINDSEAKFVLDFVGVFENGEESYQEYLKRGYPKISREEFDANAPGGMSVYNNSKKLRTFYTTKHTIYKAYCTSASTANNDGEVQMTLSEFAWVLNKKNVTKEEATKFQQKFGGCYSQDGTLVYLTYKGNKINSIGFHWTP